jgi:hypothetical protein
MAAELHEDIASIAFLLGTWRGEGKGSFPTIDPFTYREELLFEHVGEPYLLYRQESWDTVTGDPVHFERGFLRPGENGGELELCLAHPLGLTEIAHGALEGTSFSLETDAGGIGRSRTGMDVRSVIRRYRVDGDAMTYELDMATGETPLTRHLDATLRRHS